VRDAGETAWLGTLVVGLLAFDNLTMVHGRIATLDMLVLAPILVGSWLALRGLRTLRVRLDRAQSNAQELVRRLTGHATLSEVRYPGFGGMVSIVLAGGAPAGELVTHSTRLWVNATSLGGVESTFERRRRWKTEPTTIPEGLVRLSVGIEDVEDLWADLSQALALIG